MRFPDERSETCRNKVACPRPHGQRVAELRCKRSAAQLLRLCLLPEAMLPLDLTEVKSAASGLSPRVWCPFNLWGSPRGALFRAAAQALPAWCPHLGPVPAGPASSLSPPVPQSGPASTLPMASPTVSTFAPHCLSTLPRLHDPCGASGPPGPSLQGKPGASLLGLLRGAASASDCVRLPQGVPFATNEGKK